MNHLKLHIAIASLLVIGAHHGTAEPVLGFEFRKDDLAQLEKFEVERDTVRIHSLELDGGGQPNVVVREVELVDQKNQLRLTFFVVQDATANEKSCMELLPPGGSHIGAIPVISELSTGDECYVNRSETICLFKIENIACRLRNTGRNFWKKRLDGSISKIEESPDHNLKDSAAEIIASIRDQNSKATLLPLDITSLGLQLNPPALRRRFEQNNIINAVLSCELPRGARLKPQSKRLSVEQREGQWFISNPNDFAGDAEVVIFAISSDLLLSPPLRITVPCEVGYDPRQELSFAEEQMIIKALMKEGVLDKNDYDTKFKERAILVLNNPNREAISKASMAEIMREQEAHEAGLKSGRIKRVRIIDGKPVPVDVNGKAIIAK